MTIRSVYEIDAKPSLMISAMSMPCVAGNAQSTPSTFELPNIDSVSVLHFPQPVHNMTTLHH